MLSKVSRLDQLAFLKRVSEGVKVDLICRFRRDSCVILKRKGILFVFIPKAGKWKTCPEDAGVFLKK